MVEDERAVYRAALAAVAEHTGLSPEIIFRHRHPPRWVGAWRWVAIKLLEESGLTRSAIRRLTGRGWNAVTYPLDRWAARRDCPMYDPEGGRETYAEALAACHVRMRRILDEGA